MKQHSIAVISNEPWNEVWFSKQHYANELSKMGFDTYFINAPTKWRPLNLFSFSIKSNETTRPNLIVLEYVNNFPLKIFPRFFLHLNDFFNSWKLKKAIGTEQPVIWWQFDPFRFVNVYFFRSIKRIYHVVDPFQHIWSNTQIAQHADLVVLVSKYYERYYKNLQERTIYIPHGVSDQEFLIDSNKLNQIKRKVGSNYILWIGTINIDIDYLLLKTLINELHEIPFVIIGPIAINGQEKNEFTKICNCTNVNYVGLVAAEELKYYVALSKVGIVPYKKDKSENIHRTPLKILNYLSQKKPIVTTLNYELTMLNNNGIYIAESEIEFIETVREIYIEEKTINKEKVSTYIEEILYPKLIEKILNQL